MTTFTIPDTEIMRGLHGAARRHGLRIEFINMGEPEPGGYPYHWRLAITKSDAPQDIVYGHAVRSAGELPEAVREAWKTFVGWGIV